MSLKEKLEKEEQDEKDSERIASNQVPIALGAVQVVFRAVQDFLADLPAQITVGKTTLKQQQLKAWSSVPFPTLHITLRKQTISVAPVGPGIGVPFRIDLISQQAMYSLIWNGQGNSINHWSIVPHIEFGKLDLKASKPVSKEWLDDAFQKLVGL
jgi:hypothetical protein